jgi:hypothetical protein
MPSLVCLGLGSPHPPCLGTHKTISVWDLAAPIKTGSFYFSTLPAFSTLLKSKLDLSL